MLRPQRYKYGVSAGKLWAYENRLAQARGAREIEQDAHTER